MVVFIKTVIKSHHVGVLIDFFFKKNGHKSILQNFKNYRSNFSFSFGTSLSR